MLGFSQGLNSENEREQRSVQRKIGKGSSHKEILSFQDSLRAQGAVVFYVNHRLDFNIEFAGTYRPRRVFIRKRLPTTCKSPLTPEVNRTDTRGGGAIAGKCPPVGDSQSNEERSDDLLDRMIRRSYPETAGTKRHGPGFVR